MLLVTIAFGAWSALSNPSLPAEVAPSAGPCVAPAAAILAPASDDAIAPAAKKDEVPTGELARFTTTDNLRIDATFHPVPKAKEPVPAVLLLHDLGADQAQLATLVDKFLKRKMAVLTFDLRGHGVNRTDERDWEKLDDAARASLAPFMVNDVQAALNWLGGESRVQGNRLHVVGHGFGALLALRAARDERVVSATLSLPDEDRYGFSLRTLLPDVEGLATQIVTTAAQEEHMRELLVEADLVDAVDLVAVKAEPELVLADKKLPNALVKWVDEHRDGQPVVRERK